MKTAYTFIQCELLYILKIFDRREYYNFISDERINEMEDGFNIYDYYGDEYSVRNYYD